MTQYIDKAKVVAEIEKCVPNYISILNKVDKSCDNWVESTLMLESKIDALQHIKHFINTLEVKEMDLNADYIEEIYSHIDGIKDTADRMTSGNFMHYRAAIKLYADTIAKVLELIGLKQRKENNYGNN